MLHFSEESMILVLIGLGGGRYLKDYECVMGSRATSMFPAILSHFDKILKKLDYCSNITQRKVFWYVYLPNHLLQKGIATHARILVWGISWTEELAGYTVHGGHRESDTAVQVTFTSSHLCFRKIWISILFNNIPKRVASEEGGFQSTKPLEGGVVWCI